MLYFIQSNRLERLFDRLCEILADSQGNPLLAQEIVVQNPGMARWLSQQIAQHSGIAANLYFPLPARFIWETFDSQLELEGDDRSFDRSVLVWQILDELSGSVPHDSFAGVARYLQDDHDGRKAFHLSGRIADLFDQYLVYRPDMLLEWESAPNSDWQAILWKKLTSSAGPHRARFLQQFRQKARQGALDSSPLPPRICIFGVSSLAPVYLEVIHAISTVVDVYLFHLSPCRDYWADLASDTEIAKKRAGSKRHNRQEDYTYYDTGNPLLASLGKVGREFVSQVYDLKMIEEEHYEEPQTDSILTCLQRDILDLVDHSDPMIEKVVAAAKDKSVQFHSCHSRMREIQVLHDRLLEMFEGDPGVKPGNILVMAPGIEEYASAISAVFNAAEGDMFIPWSLADRSICSESSLADSFLNLFDLCEGRCSAPDVISFFETGSVMRRFRIDEDGLATIRKWIGTSGIRWGLDQKHRSEFGRDLSGQHSWSFGMSRLFMGFFMGDVQDLVHGLSPYGSISNDKGVVLGRFAAFLDRLNSTRQQLTLERGVAEWAELLLEMLDDFFDPGTDEEDQQTLSALREGICSLADNCQQAGFTREVSLSMIRAWLDETLAQSSSGQAFLSGRVTFCNMVPMRSVPFSVICLLGMNDTDYPRNQSAVGFDLMAKNPQPGDRNRRDDDRYLFLEALISARKVLYISWLGRNLRDNSPRPPSVVVADLQDYLRRSFVNASGKPIDPPVVEHPLQPFSARCFDGTPDITSYAGQWLPKTDEKGNCVFAAHILPEPPEEWREVDVGQLVRFWSHPVRFLLTHRLEMQVRDEGDLLEENEPFFPGFLERYVLGDRVLGARLEGQGVEKLYLQLQAEGLLPHENFGRNYYRELSGNAEAFMPGVYSLLQEPKDPLEVDLVIGSFHLKGWLTGLFSEGCIRYRPAKIKGKDMVTLWVEHLVYNALDLPGYNRRSIYIASDKIVAFQPVAEPHSELHKLLDLYWQGLSKPLHFYPETSRAWFEAAEGRKENEAQKVWNSGFKSRGEGEDLGYRIALQGTHPLDRDFEQLATAVYSALYDHLENDNADV